MADIKLDPSSTMSLPPPPSFAGAPGQQQYDPSTANGQNNLSHMPPPPLPPVVIPQNNNPIPTAMTSPKGDSAAGDTPGSAASFIRRAAPEPNKRALYVGGLDPRVTEDILRQIFETTGHVQNVKIIPDKNMGAVSFVFPVLRPTITMRLSSSIDVDDDARSDPHFRHGVRRCLLNCRTKLAQCVLHVCYSFTEMSFSSQSKGFNYGFIEYDDPAAAERAMQSLNGRRVHNAVNLCPDLVTLSPLTGLRKSASIGHTNPIAIPRRILQTTSTSSLVT